MSKPAPEVKSRKNAPQLDSRTSARPAAGDLAGLVSLIISALVFSPPFLISCLVADIGTSFTFGALELGIILSLYGATGALGAWVSGMAIDRAGARIGLVIAAALTTISAVGSALADSWHALLIMFSIAGLGGGIVGPAAVRLLISGIAPGRRGFAFALRQSAAPLAGMLTGVFAAAAQAQFGWRGTFLGFAAISAVIAIVAIAWGREGASVKKGSDSRPLRTETVALLIFAAVLLGAGVSTFSGFVVATGIAIGMSSQAAGLLLAASSAAAIVARLVGGWAADRRSGGHLIRVAALLVLGALSCVAVALAPSATLLIPAVVAVSTTAWSSNALYAYAVVNNQPHAPAKATGIVQLGAFTGSAVGPFLFGFTIEHAGGRVAWLLLALVLFIASAIVLLARRTFGVRTSSSQ